LGGTLATSGGNVTLTVTGTTNATFPVGNIFAGLMGLPRLGATVQTAGLSFALANIGYRAEMNCTAACTVTIPANSSVAFPIDNAVLIVENQCSSTTNVTVQVTTDTLYLEGVGSPGSRTIAPCGIGTFWKQAQTVWTSSGLNIS